MSYKYDRTASSKGPVHELLDKHYNDMHDLAWSLGKVLEDYDAVGVYLDGPAERDVNIPKKAIQDLIKALHDITREKASDALDAERDFVKKHGTPAEYVQRMRRETFPR